MRVVAVAAIMRGASGGGATRTRVLDSVGVCWTRNLVDVREAKTGVRANRTADISELRNLVLSAGSLKARHNVSTCLFTDLEPGLLASAIRELAGAPGGHLYRGLALFDAVLEDGRAAFLAGLGAAGNGKVARWARGAGTLVNSRLGRLANLANAPFEVTLFLDDDTYLCPDAPLRPELDALHAAHGGRGSPAVRAHPFTSPSSGVRPSKLFAAYACAWAAGKRGSPPARSLEAAFVACVDAHVKAATWCHGAQGGALVADRRDAERLGAFVDGWLDEYVHYYHKFANGTAFREAGHEGHYGADQTALEKLFAASDLCGKKPPPRELDFGYLPANFNMRDIPSRSSCDWPLFGRTHVIHHKHYVNGGTLQLASTRVDALCATLNGPRGPAISNEKGHKTPKCAWM